MNLKMQEYINLKFTCTSKAHFGKAPPCIQQFVESLSEI